jgi:hypothetical protein
MAYLARRAEVTAAALSLPGEGGGGRYLGRPI